MLKSITMVSMAMTLTTLAHASEMAPVLRDAVAAASSEVREITSIVQSHAGQSAVIRHFSREDGIQLWILLPPYQGQVTAERIAAVDRFSDLVFAGINARLGQSGSAGQRFQGFSAHQYTDGSSGITYAALVPVKRAGSARKEAGTQRYCADLPESAAPGPYPLHAADRYSEIHAVPDAQGIWYQYTRRLAAIACPAGACQTASPGAYLWTTGLHCNPMEPQPKPLPPTPPVPLPGKNTEGANAWDIRPVWTPGHTGDGWTFTCTYGGVSVDCFTG